MTGVAAFEGVSTVPNQTGPIPGPVNGPGPAATMTDMPEHTAAAAARRRNAAAADKARQVRRRLVALAGAAAGGAAVSAAGLVAVSDLRRFLATGVVPTQTALLAAIVLGFVAASLAAQAAAMRDGVREAGRWGRRFRTLLTAVAAIIAAAASASGMWKFMGDVLHVHNVYARMAIFAVFEIALFTEALRARAIRVNNEDAPRWGPDAIAVWVFAVTTGVLAATDEPTWPGRLARLALALTAAWLFERMITEEREAKQGKTRAKIAWRFSLERIAVRLGLADASGRTTAEVSRARQLARLATLAYRAETSMSPFRWWRTRCTNRYRKALQAVNEELDLANDPDALQRLHRAIALLHFGVEHTSREHVRHASPWTVQTVPPPPAAPELPSVNGRPPVNGRAAASRKVITANTRTPAPVGTAARAARYAELIRTHGTDWSQEQYADALGVSARTLRNDPWKAAAEAAKSEGST